MKFRVVLLLFFFIKLNFFYGQTTKIKCCKNYNLKAVFITGKKNTIAENKSYIYLNTKAKTGKCYTSCNLMEFNFKSKKSTFNFIEIKPDKLPCPDNLVGLEEDLKENLNKVNSIKVVKKQLIFFNNTDTLLIFNE